MKSGTFELIMVVLLAAIILYGVGSWLWKLWKKCKNK